MRAALKTVEQVKSGEPLEIGFAGARLLLDPSGVAFLPEDRILLVADLHLEKGSSFARRRVYLPPYDTPATLARLAAMVAKYDPAMVISLGDSFHDDEASRRLSSEATEAIAAMARGRDMVWVTGNHDPSPPDGVPGVSVAELALGATILRHIPEPGHSRHEVAGHLHPCARLVRRGRAVRRSCFATDGVRMVMPSFGVYTGGLNVRDEAFSGLFDISSFCAYMLGTDRVYGVGAKDLFAG